jgi:hypothetical protein
VLITIKSGFWPVLLMVTGVFVDEDRFESAVQIAAIAVSQISGSVRGNGVLILHLKVGYAPTPLAMISTRRSGLVGLMRTLEMVVGSLTSPWWIVRYCSMVLGGILCSVRRRLWSFDGVRATGFETGKEGKVWETKQEGRTSCAVMSFFQCRCEESGYTSSCSSKASNG